MEIEKFSKDGKDGARVKFTFTSQNNKNGVSFNPLSVFTEEAVASALTDLDHDQNYERFSKEETAWQLLESRIEGKVVKHDVQLETTDTELFNVVTSEGFKGFSANLIPIKSPVPSRNAIPRFYEDDGIVLEAFTALKTQEPAFIGADQVTVEMFSVSDNVVLKETFHTVEPTEPSEQVPPAETPTPTTSEPKADNKAEKFGLSWVEVGEYCKIISTQQIGKVTEMTTSESGRTVTIKLVDGSNTTITELESSQDYLLSYLSLSDVMDYLMTQSGIEGFSSKTQAPEPASPSEAMQNAINNAKNMSAVATSEKFSKSEKTVEKPTDNYQTKSLIQNIV